MCIYGPTKKGIKQLPECGTYYKVLNKFDKSPIRSFFYPKGKTIVIPETKQDTGRLWRIIIAGGHFYRNREDAEAEARRHDRVVARFRIYRKHISHIGKSFSHKAALAGKSQRGNRALTILASKARRID